MLTDFNQISNTARIWIYASPQVLTSTAQDFIKHRVTAFVQNWTRHGSDVIGSYTIAHDRFLILAADTERTPVSGCSIDSSVHLVKGIGKHLNIDFFDKLKVDWIDSNELLHRDKIPDFKEKIKRGIVDKDTRIFNHLIETKSALETTWLVSAEKSWCGRFF